MNWSATNSDTGASSASPVCSKFEAANSVPHTAFKFPCTFPIKAIGQHSHDFERSVLTIIQRHVPEIDLATVTSRPSSNGNYLAVTATFTARSRAQLDALYIELSGHEQVLMVL
jgi:uncharacterized protein